MNFYYHPDPASDLTLSQEESSHAVKVLRKKTGDTLHLMDGIGGKYEAEITEANFRKCEFKILKKEEMAPREAQIHIGIAPTKNIDRLEWFVEKACELGVDQITIFITQHTERKKVKLDRLEKKAISAMKQSKSFWKCKIHWADKFPAFLSSTMEEQRFIAYVETGEESALRQLLQAEKDTIILIGPEGDFSPEEVKLATDAGFTAVNLGKNVLRTETAGIIAAHTFNLINGW
ncbi:16S rRNA (uracil(1498)-N(3))-methyltransferase [Reichenbachiella ulvae]|uniref:Ribosomal RNA small subunit methyltransferase E n=1 Tax=Reichenbachiella ulvae TaxID=2980104 RepID=A0ABT3CNF6_9BACT|nr:16S rRNA (uracil(1498)-N(3))-methyltransferase [Reichenbachiella ulvae]MCV9385139.1 16S rRNA (uracil(1498)-N(3))-methyltransferase [Reichenbachiella ulvae]